MSGPAFSSRLVAAEGRLPAARGAARQAARTPPSPACEDALRLTQTVEESACRTGGPERHDRVLFPPCLTELQRAKRRRRRRRPRRLPSRTPCPRARAFLCRMLRADRTPRAGVRNRTERRPHGTQATWDIPLSLPVAGACRGIRRPARPMGGEGKGQGDRGCVTGGWMRETGLRSQAERRSPTGLPPVRTGPVWLAGPSPYGSSIRYSMPVSRRFPDPDLLQLATGMPGAGAPVSIILAQTRLSCLPYQ